VEEQQDLSTLKDDIPTSGSKTLARSFGTPKYSFPDSVMVNFTSCQGPISDVPDKLPFETKAGVMTAPIDRLKDIFSMFPKEE